ncbi:MAG: T9SS type A sorting domain-containing protein [candidate division Zixibacteria bacterium]|nr:T9SS type A sorting domain-containing protein [candidate division Zixibacteria bacterium]
MSFSFNWDASNYSSGIYFYKLTTDNYTTTKKMNLLK